MNNKSCIYRKYFEEKILKQVEPIEKERRKMIRRVVLSSLFCFLCGIILAVILVIIDFDNIYRIFLFPPVLFLMYAFIIKGIINFIVVGKEYQQMLYEKVLPLLQILNLGQRMVIQKLL